MGLTDQQKMEAEEILQLDDISDATEEAPYGYTTSGRIRKKPLGKSRKASKTSLALERTEAKLLTAGIATLVASRYGQRPVEPDEKETEKLAKILKIIGAYPPLSYVQSLLRRLLPIFGSGGTGDSFLALFSGYAYAWYAHNPVLAEQIYVADPHIPDIPIYPKARAREKMTATIPEEVIVEERQVQYDGPISEAESR